jgi:transposase
VVTTTGDRFAVNLISAVTAKGKLRFAAYDGHLNGPVFIDFCRRLLHDAPGMVFLILDGHLVHRSGAVKQFVASTEGRLRLFFLPGYSPELNPDGWVWKNIKTRSHRSQRDRQSCGSETQGARGAAPAAKTPAPCPQLLR